MEHRAWRVDARAVVVADVHALADERVAGFGEVDPDLVLAACLEAALDDPAAAVAALKKHVPTTDEALALESWEIEPNIIVIDETRENGLGYLSEDRVADTIEVADLSTEETVEVDPADVFTVDFLPASPVMPPN